MKTWIRWLIPIVLVALFGTARADDLGFAKVYLRELEQQVVVAIEKTDAMYAWQQCELTLKSFEETVAKLAPADRAPFQAKIDQYKPTIMAGAARNRAGIIVRRIRDALDGAKADIASGTKLFILQEGYFDRLDKYFAENDLSALPPAEVKKLKDEYAAVKQSAPK